MTTQDATGNTTATTAATATDAQLEAARTDVVAEIARTDVKASSLLSGLGLPLAALVAVVPGRHLGTAATVLVGLGGAALIAAMLMALLVVRPHLGRAAQGSPGSYLHWARSTAVDLAADLAVDRRAERIVTLSQIARAKFVALRRAIDVTVIALITLAIALAVALV